MIKKINSVIALALCFSFTNAIAHAGNKTFRLPANVTTADYQPNTIVVKFKPEFRQAMFAASNQNKALNNIATGIGPYSLTKLFPVHKEPTAPVNARGEKLVDLSLIAQLKFSSIPNIEKAINALLATGMFEYAEPKYIHKSFYTPNDPSIGQQYFLTKIQAYNAWDISKGDTNIVIGIVDSGTDWNHPDLEANVQLNYNDPINGTDDDSDGYTDNYRGWDVSMNDNNPMVDMSNHGSHVSGCAAAVTDNATGVASPGFYTRFLPVKAASSTATTTIDAGYEGIVYAADHGCDIINCSWGGPGGGQLGQDAVTYATINMGALVVASAGNSGVDEANYPASYLYAFNVASTNTQDNKSGFSTFNYSVDVSAPGSQIYSTVFNNSYTNMSGTSMASPITAGCAAIVKAMNPTFNGLQCGEQLRMTADNIYTLSGNLPYVNKLGGGRVNLYRALTETPMSVRMDNLVQVDGNDNAFVVGDTLQITGDIINYLAATTNLTVTLSSTSTYVTVLDGTTSPGAMATLTTVNNNADPFTVKINPTAPVNAVINFTLTFTDGTYTSSQFFSIVVNVDYINITINDVLTTITSKGRIFYNGTGQLEGLGFDYLGDNLIYEGGLMIGTPSNVADNTRDAGTNDNDFVSQNAVQKLLPSVKSDFDLFGKFNDNNASPRLNLLVSHKGWAWDANPFRKFVIVQYNIKNTGANSLNSLYAGIFCDWDIQTFANNKAATDNTVNMGYTWCTDPSGKFAGIKLLTSTPFVNYAIDNVAGGSGGIDITNDYTSTEKYTSLSTNRATAGGTGTGVDVCQVTSTGPFTIASNDSVTVAFAILAGDDLVDLQNSATQAQIKYDEATSVKNVTGNNGFMFFAPYPNPSSNLCELKFTLQKSSAVSITLLNSLGQMVYNSYENYGAGVNTKMINTEKLGAGVYTCLIKVNESMLTHKLMVE
ncbi:MAG TPA: S8 family serine peptidase [Bacteroidia bacterium]|nr:S8 family serine peptidase [Bacteroidia bacterium]HNU33728.1 S8 family serine peptidase [Bacteroidia bacterium]